MVRYLRDGVRWKLRNEFWPLLDAVLSSPEIIVRESLVRTVTLHWAGSAHYYVKRYFIGRAPLRSLLFLLKKPPAEQQWEAALTLESLGVPCVRPLACGVQRSSRGVVESTLITEGFPGVPLTEWTRPDWPAVFRFLEQMHDAGALQPDLHAGNLLVCPETGELRLVDMGHVRFERRVTQSERQENLAFLRLSVPIPVSPEVERLSRDLRQFVYLHRSKRCLKHNREFAPARRGGLTWQVRLPFFHGPLRRLAEDPDRFGCRDGLVVKHFKPEKRAAIISELFRGSRARRTYQRFYHLELLGIPAPRPVAFADRRNTGFPVCSYLVTQEIPEARTLASVLDGKVPLERSVVRNLAQLIGKLHDEGFSAPDLEPTSFLVGLDKAVFLMDPDRLYFGDPILESTAAVDLSRLARKVAASPAVGRLERFVFLRAYCRTRGLRQVPRSDRLTHCPPHSTP